MRAGRVVVATVTVEEKRRFELSKMGLEERGRTYREPSKTMS